MSHKNCPKRLKNRIFSLLFIIPVLTFFVAFLLSDTIYAQTAEEISLQGKIVRNDTGYEGLNVVNGTPSCVTASNPDGCDFQVKYYDAATSGTLEYTEEFTNVEIGDYGGVFNLSLGSVTGSGNYSSLEDLLKNESTIYIQIEFAPGGSQVYSEVFSRTPLNASAYSIRSKYAEGSVNDAFKFYDASSVSSTVEGSVYYDSDDNELKLYNGSAWVSVGNAGASAWGTSDVSSFNHGGYLASGGIGTFDNFTLDTDDDRLSINVDQPEGGLSVYSSYGSGSAWPLVSFKADHSSFDTTLLELTQDGSGDILLAKSDSNDVFQIDNFGDMHLALNGVGYWEPFESMPTEAGGQLNPNGSGVTKEGCLYNVSGSLYWDSDCTGTSPTTLTGGSTLWTDGGTFTYLTDTAEDLVLGASTTTNAPFFFDVSQKRLGIGTGTPQAAIDIAGASSTITNTSGDITITPAEDLYIDGSVGIGTDSPVYDLEIVSTGSAVLRLTSGTDEDTRLYLKGDTEWVFQNDGDGSLGTADYFHIRDTTAGASRMVFDTSGNVGIGTASPSAKLDLQGTIDSVQLSVKGFTTQSNNIIEVTKSDDSDLLTLSNTGLLSLSGDFQGGSNNSYDIGSTSTRWKDVYTQGQLDIGANGDSGSIRYNTTNDELEFSNDGSTWIAMAGATKTDTLSAEYPGAVLAADGTANVGAMTSDAEGSSSDSMNYYEWTSSETTLQDYDVRLRFTIPHDFSSWGTNAFTLNFATEANSSTNNKVDIYVYEENSGTVDDSSTNQYSSSAGVWKTTTIQGADLGDCNAAGETCVIFLRMYSANDNYVRVGDIDVNYNRKL
jgi:hypothetical protein